MTNHGGDRDEPTSYGLRPPQAQEAAQETAQETVPYQPSAPGPAAHEPTHHHHDGERQDGGRLIGGRYRLVARLGHGGMGTVWRARDEVVEREIAVKEPRLPGEWGERQRATAYERMQREARAAARIDHPSVVTVHDVVVEDGRPWIVMELVRGQSLADRLHEGTLDPREAAEVGLAVLDALRAAHEAGVLHRDVKPDNVLLGRGDRVVLTDFGIAQVEGEQQLTETGEFIGSPEFIAPERVLGQRPGPASDLWSLGVVLYAAVEGVSPFRRSHTPATLQAVLSAEPQVPARAEGPLATVIMQLLRKEPGARPPAAEVREALASVAGLASTRVGPGRLSRAARWVPPVLVGSRRARYGLGAGVLAVVLALTLLIVNPFSGDDLPDGWLVRPEQETVRASLAVPDDYERSEGESGDNVRFYDPSNVFQIYVERRTVSGTGKSWLKGAAWAKFYRDGGTDGTQIKDERVTSRTTSHQGATAYETVVDWTPYSSTEDNPYRYRYHDLLIPQGGDSGTYWRLQIYMPAEGWAHPAGERLYRDVVAHLELQGL
ncbi:serine/threonine-protein kinase [Streptomyces sp. NPDC058001]|uniref:serine/threonine-protein kinase n=1 Tax=Streptomyces sp. NPDC058001 TaxID=3346300 RepID=UPI0036EF27FE